MFNVTIIKLKDIVKIGIILILIYVFFNFIIKNFKNTFDSLKFDSINFIKKGIGQQSNIIKEFSNEKNIQTDEKVMGNEKNKELLEISSILEQGSNIFSLGDKKNRSRCTYRGGQKEPVLMSPQKWTKRTGTNVPKRTDTDVPKTEVVTEIVTAQPLADRYDREYNGVKIKNETEFELTDDVLNPEGLNINTSNILIFHTHTCESYTQSENYLYEPTRNL